MLLPIQLLVDLHTRSKDTRYVIPISKLCENYSSGVVYLRMYCVILYTHTPAPYHCTFVAGAVIGGVCFVCNTFADCIIDVE